MLKCWLRSAIASDRLWAASPLYAGLSISKIFNTKLKFKFYEIRKNSQRVAVVHGLIWMDKSDTQLVLLFKDSGDPVWASLCNTDDPVNASQLSISCFEWTAATTGLVQLSISCFEWTAATTGLVLLFKQYCSLEDWWHYQQVAFVHSLICMEKPDTSISTTVQGLKWSCMSKSLQDWWPSQQVTVVLMLFWMDSCNNLIGSVVQRVTLTGRLMTLQWQLSIAWFEWTSQTPQMVQVASACIHTAATVSMLQLDNIAVQMKQVFPGRQHCSQQLNADYCQPPQQVHVDCTLTLSGYCVYQPKLSTLFKFAASWLMHLTWMTSRFCTKSAAQLHKNELAINKRKRFLLVRWCKHARSHLTC